MSTEMLSLDPSTNPAFDELRRIDFAIAQQVFGCNPLTARYDASNVNSEPQYHWGYPLGHDFAPRYSTDRAAALEVVDRLLERDLRVEMSGNKQGWLVTIDNGNCENEVSAQAATLQEAICIAALKAVAAKPETKTA